jgi:serine/threonine-protein kinase
MGTVWLAHHEALDAPCAVKFVAGNLEADAEALARFEREAKAAARIRSPHVVQIFDYGEWDGKHYIAMEYLEGEDLGERLERLGRLTPRQTYEVVEQVCRALTKAHDAGIVHRDLKPDNIYLVKEKHGDHVKVLDFGIAKAAVVSGSKTKTGAMLGTPYYMSPEQIDGLASIDHRSDLWSLAVITFECLVGRMPFNHEALSQLITKIIHEELPVPSEQTSVPEGFDAWWRIAASRDPDDRFQDADAFLQALGEALGLADRTSVSAPPASEQEGSSSVDSEEMGRAATLRSDARELAMSSTDVPLSKPTEDVALVPVRRSPLPIVIAAAAVVLGVVVWLLATRGETPAESPRLVEPAHDRAPAPSRSALPPEAPPTAEASATAAPPEPSTDASAPASTAPPLPTVAGPIHRAQPQPSAQPSAPPPEPSAAPPVDKDHGF